MTAAQDTSACPHPLSRGASPAVVHEWLLPEDRGRFAAEYEAARHSARGADPAEVKLAVAELVERWRQLAVLQSDPAAFRRTVRRLAEVATGVAPADDEPLHVTRANAGI